MDLDYIESLARMVRGTHVTELSVRRGDHRVTVRRQPGGVVVAAPADEPGAEAVAIRPAPNVEPLLPEVYVADAALVPVGGAAVGDPAMASAPEPRFEIICAQRVGVFLRAADANGGAAAAATDDHAAPPLVRVGERVAAAQQIGSILSMGVANEVDSPANGRVVGVFVADGEPVEYGQPLFHLEVGPPPGAAAQADEGAEQGAPTKAIGVRGGDTA